MITAKVLEAPIFKPVTIQITITDQDNLDKLTSLVNCAAIFKVFPDLHLALFDLLREQGEYTGKYVNDYVAAFRK